MTRWDVYVAELELGHLQWGMLHTEKFFQENAKLMEGTNGDFSVVKVRLEFGLSSRTNGVVSNRDSSHACS